MGIPAGMKQNCTLEPCLFEVSQYIQVLKLYHQMFTANPLKLDG